MFYYFIFFFLLFALPACAAEEPTAPAAPPSEKPSTPFPGSLAGGKGKSGDSAIDITADNSLEWNENERVYTARGHAKAKRGDAVIEADTLKAYDRKKPDGSSEVWRMLAQGHVKLTSKDNVATGDTGEYDIDSRKAKLTGDHLTLNTKTDQVTARDSLEYWETEQVALAKGDATATRQGRKVEADEMIAKLKPDAKGELAIDTLEAKGSAAKGQVKIVTTQDAILCDNVVYNLTQNSAVLTGHVNITRGSNQLKGDRVETDFKTGRSRLMNAGSGRVHALITAAKSTPGGKAGGAAPAMTPFAMQPVK